MSASDPKGRAETFSCLVDLYPGEPVFVLRAREPATAALLRLWATYLEAAGRDRVDADSARDVAARMEAWARAAGADPDHWGNVLLVAAGVVARRHANGYDAAAPPRPKAGEKL